LTWLGIPSTPSRTAPDASEVKPTYNEAALLERVDAHIRGALTWTASRATTGKVVLTTARGGGA
jgi:hypothetical protein